MADKYVKLSDVEEMLEKAHVISDGEYGGYCTEDVKLLLLPIADYAPVVHGHWEERGRYYKCSNCGDSIASLVEMEHCAGRKWDYCPCCGAKMDDEESKK